MDQEMREVLQSGERLVFQGQRRSSALVSDQDGTREAEMARILQQSNEPQYADVDGLRIEISGVGSSDPTNYNRDRISEGIARGDDLRPTVGNADRLGLIDPAAEMSYGEQMSHVGR